MKKLLCAVLLGIFLFSACGGEEAAFTPPLSETVPIAHFAPTPLVNLDADWAEIAAFSRAFFHAVLDAEYYNPVISPLSAYFALAMTALGADSNTAEEFSAVLGMEALPLARALASLYAHLTNTAGQTVLNISNSIWVNQKTPVIAEFNYTTRRYFGAPAFTRDFGTQATINEINNWIYNATEGLIGDVIEELCPVDDVMLLINALYLLARWSWPMRMGAMPFYPAGAAAVQVPSVSNFYRYLPIYVAPHFMAALLPFDDDRTGFLLVMPTDGTSLRDFAGTHCLYEILQSVEPQQSVQVQLPTLSKEFELTMNDFLESMGLYSAFSPGLARFPYLAQTSLPVFISEVRQVIRLELDNDGIEAAAVTVVHAQAESAPMFTISLDFNRPFLYGIFDLPTGVPFFMGAVDDPSR